MRWKIHTLCVLALAAMIILTGGTATAQQVKLMPYEEPWPVAIPKAVPAFPGAWGGGMFTVGGRGGKVFEVTTLDDSGPGSLREAMLAEGPRTVVFRVSGIIRLKSEIIVTNPNLTIAGQTAPGDGICVANESVRLNAPEMIVRHMRFRRGTIENNQDSLDGDPEGHVMIDHVSASWGMDENISFYRYMRENPEGGTRIRGSIRNVTIQWTISSEALNPRNHAFGGTWGGVDSTFHHNLFACNTGRNPSIGAGGMFDYRNNVTFNWRHRTLDGTGGGSRINVISNYYKSGPITQEGSMKHRIARVEVRNGRVGRFYVAGNYVDGYPEITADNWAGGVFLDQTSPTLPISLADARADEPFDGWPINHQNAVDAFESVMNKVGATLPKRDPVDRRVIEMVRTGKVKFDKGIIEHPDQVGGYPEYKSAPAPADGDHDGMPDDWEKKFGLNSNDAADGALDTDKDGYTNLEEWMNGTDPKAAVDYLDLKNNVDTIS